MMKEKWNLMGMSTDSEGRRETNSGAKSEGFNNSGMKMTAGGEK